MKSNQIDSNQHSPSYLQTSTTIVAAMSVVGLCWLLANGSPNQRPAESKSVASDAMDYVRERKPEPLSGPLQSLLADVSKPHVPSQIHPLIGQPAPAFSLTNVDGQSNNLESFLKHGPVVLVFYYGYSCNHCVSQLFDLNEDLKYFRELGATIVAIGPDSPDTTRSKYIEFGSFGYTVLADTDRQVAARYGLFRQKVGETKEWQAHGTFVLDRQGVVRWANTGNEPFTGNVTLLAELAQLENRLEMQSKSVTRSTQP